MPRAVVRNRGPWSHRVLIWAFATGLAFLLFWLSGLLIRDIGDVTYPDYREIEKELIDPALLAESEAVGEKMEENRRAIERDTTRQNVLRQSTDAVQRTMNQLLDFQRLAIEKGGALSPEEQKALADSQQIFLDNQRRFQEMNQQIAALEDERDQLEKKRRELDEKLEEARVPVQEEFEERLADARWRAAALQLGVMLPLLLVSVIFFVKGRGTRFAPIVYAFGAAVVARNVLVMFEYFPKRYFYYILLVTSILIVLKILFSLIRSVDRPKWDWLIHQYREAYERFLCPVCEFPIRRGPLKYMFWTRRTAHRLAARPSESSSADGPYTCPMCSTRLFEECPQCHAVRHTLLPACESCGDSKSVADITQAAGAAPNS